mmetsp:Transcript_12081/g.42360  ORF Transcript_12081/g.42360 Transcript_12081/m.42360 type:complete len:204 (-) Transcript_12081:417-1028(-)
MASHPDNATSVTLTSTASSSSDAEKKSTNSHLPDVADTRTITRACTSYFGNVAAMVLPSSFTVASTSPTTVPATMNAESSSVPAAAANADDVTPLRALTANGASPAPSSWMAINPTPDVSVAAGIENARLPRVSVVAPAPAGDDAVPTTARLAPVATKSFATDVEVPPARNAACAVRAAGAEGNSRNATEKPRAAPGHRYRTR